MGSRIVDCEGSRKAVGARRMATLPPFAAVIVAAGKGLRAGGGVPKQFGRWQGKPLVRHSVERMLAAGARPICVVIPLGAEDLAAEALAGLEGVRLATGGRTRQESVIHGLLSIGCCEPDFVLIHDAARPDCPIEVIERLLTALQSSPGAVPVL